MVIIISLIHYVKLLMGNMSMEMTWPDFQLSTDNQIDRQIIKMTASWRLN